MISIIPASDYKTIPWKNGLGETTELAINKGGNLNNFDWRLSIASVSKNGLFSDFSGYSRQLILISANSIILQHSDRQGIETIDQLSKVLDMSTFDGGCKTQGTLPYGPIKDFNIMTKTGKFKANVNTYLKHQEIKLPAHKKYFIYCLEDDLFFQVNNTGKKWDKSTSKKLPAKYLLTISAKNENKITLLGEKVIVIELESIAFNT